MTYTMEFIVPLDGVMLNNSASKVYQHTLEIECQLLSKPNQQIIFNNILATYRNNIYKVKIRLDSYRNILEAIDIKTEEKGEIVVCWLKEAEHWAEATLEGCHALRSQGIRVLFGRAIRKQDTQTLQNPTLVGLSNDVSIAYYLDCEQSRAVCTYGFYKVHSEDIIFSPNTATLNSHTPKKIRELLDSFACNYPKRSYIGLIIHVQYFYPRYQNYLPDYKERVLAGVEWCVENGYDSSFLAEVVFE